MLRSRQLGFEPCRVPPCGCDSCAHIPRSLRVLTNRGSVSGSFRTAVMRCWYVHATHGPRSDVPSAHSTISRRLRPSWVRDKKMPALGFRCTSFVTISAGITFRPIAREPRSPTSTIDIGSEGNPSPRRVVELSPGLVVHTNVVDLCPDYLSPCLQMPVTSSP